MPTIDVQGPIDFALDTALIKLNVAAARLSYSPQAAVDRLAIAESEARAFFKSLTLVGHLMALPQRFDVPSSTRRIPGNAE